MKAMLKAAEFWACSAKPGCPRRVPRDSDADAILAGLAAMGVSPGDVVTIATSNVVHLARFPGIEYAGMVHDRLTRPSARKTSGPSGHRGSRHPPQLGSFRHAAGQFIDHL